MSTGINKTVVMQLVSQDRKPNFRDHTGNLFLVRCFACNPEIGRENYSMAVSSGVCAFCGWSEAELKQVCQDFAEEDTLLAESGLEDLNNYLIELEE